MLSTVEEIESSPAAPVFLPERASIPAERVSRPTLAADSAVEIAPDYSRDQSAVLVDGAFYSLMVGLGETYLPAFALALGASRLVTGLEITSGLVAAIPIFFGSLFQLVTPFAVRRLGSHRQWVSMAVGSQALSLLLLPLVMLLDNWSVPMLFVMATWYWGSGLSGGPPWNTWMEDLVPAATRTTFFARRVRICQFCTMLGFAVGGLMLEWGKRHDRLMPAFIAVFAIAAISRGVSTYLLSRTAEPTSAKIFAKTHIGLREIMQRLRGHSGMKVLWFLFAMQASVQISGPYFTPFMLRKLDFRYDQFMLLVVLGFLGKVIALPAWGKLAHRCGARLLLWIGGVSIVPLAGLWLGLNWLPNPMLYLCVVQLLGGIGWAAYELGFFLMFFEAIPRRERTSVLTIYNFGNSAALLVGAAVGAVWLAYFRESYQAYLMLFVLSSVARLGSLVLLRGAKPAARVVAVKSAA